MSGRSGGSANPRGPGQSGYLGLSGHSGLSGHNGLSGHPGISGHPGLSGHPGGSGHNLHNLHFAKFSVLSSASLDGFSVLLYFLSHCAMIFLPNLRDLKPFKGSPRSPRS